MKLSTAKALIFGLALVAGPASAGDVPALPDTFEVQAIDCWLAGQVQQVNRVGLSVAIVKDGKLVLAKGYGKRSLDDGRPVETNTLFAIGSVTKQFTCACVFLLAEDGRLSIHDPVAKYFPDLARAKDITLLDLMNHVSGYPDYYPLDFVDRRMQRPIESDELLRQYAGGELDFEPGTKMSYSNTGFILLGRVVEKVSGESFGTFLTRRILQPLGMRDTLYEPVAEGHRLAKGYTVFALSQPEGIAPEASGWIGAAGGIYSTPSDLAKWDLALTGGRVLKPESLEQMTTRRKLSDGRLSGYGCGLAVNTQDGRQVLSHDGAVSGFNAANHIIPSTGSALIMACNVDGGIGSMAEKVLGLLLKRPSAVPAIAGPSAVATVQTIFEQLQKGRVDRRAFGEEFNHYLTAAKLSGAAKRLSRFGKPVKAEVMRTRERGGMEVTVTRLAFKDGTLSVLMYRKPNGTIEQFFVSQE